MLEFLARVLYAHFALPLSYHRKPDEVIGDAGDPYLKRWHLLPWSSAFDDVPREQRTRWQRFVTSLPSIYLHCFLRGDDDRALHDHPWNWGSFLLHGDYAEVTHEDLTVRGGFRLHGAAALVVDTQADRVEVTRYYVAGALRVHRAEFRHRLQLSTGGRAWTLFFCGWRRREWFFHCPQGPVHWRDFTDPATNGATVGRGCAQ